MQATRWTVGRGYVARVAVALLWMLALVLVLAGCTAPRGPLVVTSPDPSVKIPAYKKAVRKRDRAAVRQMVKDLESEDPAVRLYAIGALRRMTGQTFGYRYYDGDEQRRASVEQWQQWIGQAE